MGDIYLDIFILGVIIGGCVGFIFGILCKLYKVDDDIEKIEEREENVD